MDNRSIFSKTGKGSLEIAKKTLKLSSEERQTLILVDGKSNYADLQEKLSRIQPVKLRAVFERLLELGLMREFVGKSNAPEAAAPEASGAAPRAALPVIELIDGGEELDFTALVPSASVANNLAALRQAAAAAADEPADQPGGAALRDALAQSFAAEAAGAISPEEAARASREEAMRKVQAHKAAQAEATRVAATGAEAARARAAEEQARVAAEKAAEQAAEQAAKQVAEQARIKAEADRLAAEQRAREEKERQEREETARLAAEEEARRKAETGARIKAEAERMVREQRAIQEKERQEREAAARAAAEEEARVKAEAERVAREQREREEAARRAAEEEARRKAEEEARIKAEAERVAREQREREEAARRAAEEEAKRKAEEEARIKTEAERMAREQLEREEAAQRAAEEEARQKAEAARRAAEEETRIKAEAERLAREQMEREDQERREREEAPKRAAEEAARRAAEEEARKAEEEARRKSEEAARLKAEAGAEAQKKAEAERQAQQARERAEKERADRERAEREAAEKQAAAAAAVATAAAAASAAALLAQQAAATPATPAAAPAADGGDPDFAPVSDEQRRKDEVAKLLAGASRHDGATPLTGGGPDTFANTGPEFDPFADDSPKPGKEQELASRHEIEQEARDRASARAEPADTQEHPTEPAHDQAPAKVRRSGGGLPLGKIIGAVAALVLVGAIGYVFMMPVDKPSIERALSERLGEPVTVDAAKVSPFSATLTLTGVNIGPVKLASVAASTDFPALFSAQKIWKSVDITGLSIDAAAARSLIALGAREVPKTAAGKVQIQRLRITDLEISGLPVAAPKFNAEILFTSAGTLKLITLATPDDKARAILQPEEKGWLVNIESKGMIWPAGPKIAWESVRAKGVGSANGIKFEDYTIGHFGGVSRGAGELSWNNGWKFNGNLDAGAIESEAIAQAFYDATPVSGTIEGKLGIAMSSPSLARLFETLQIDGALSVSKAILKTVDLARTAQTGATAQGSTRFTDFSTTLAVAGGRVQLKDIKGVSGLLTVSGNAQLDAAKNVSGGLLVELGVGGSRAKANVKLSGTMAEPKLAK